LHSDLEELIQDSKDAFLKSLFPGVAIKKNDIGSLSFGNAINRVGSKKLGFISVGNKFRVILNTPQSGLFLCLGRSERWVQSKTKIRA